MIASYPIFTGAGGRLNAEPGDGGLHIGYAAPNIAPPIGIGIDRIGQIVGWQKLRLPHGPAGLASPFKTQRCHGVDGENIACVSEPKMLLAKELPLLHATNSGVRTNSSGLANLIAPHAFEVRSIADVKTEIFGPVLQVMRWSGDPPDVITQVNALSFGLTMGIQTRIDSRAQAMVRAAHASPRITPARGLPLWGACGAQESQATGESLESLRDWEMTRQSAPVYPDDQRTNG